MLRLLLVLAALALGALGVNGLLTADPSSGMDFVLAGVELIGAIVLIGLAFVIGKDKEAALPEAASDGSDRAAVIERLQRHTEALRRAEEMGNGDAQGNPAPVHAAIEPEDAPRPARLESPESPPEALSAGAPGPPVRADAPTTAPAAHPAPSPADAGPEAELAGHFDVRLPALMLLNVGASASAADIESAPALGSRGDVLARLRDIVPDLEIDARGRAQHAGPDHAISLDLGSGADVHTVVVDAAGRTGISLVRWFLESTGWRAFVPKLGQFIDPDGLDAVAIREE